LAACAEESGDCGVSVDFTERVEGVMKGPCKRLLEEMEDILHDAHSLEPFGLSVSLRRLEVGVPESQVYFTELFPFFTNAKLIGSGGTAASAVCIGSKATIVAVTRSERPAFKKQQEIQIDAEECWEEMVSKY